MPSRPLLLVNRRSNRGAQSLDEVVRELTSRGLAIVACLDDPEAVRDHVIDACDSVIVAGGDGTLNRAAPHLRRWRRPLGILPLGTANDLARTLGLPLELPAACGVISAGRTAWIDLGDVNGRPFFNVASLGLSVDVTRRLSTEYKRRWGRLAYLLAALRVAWRAPTFTADIDAAGEPIRVRTLQIAVGNGLYYGGGLPIDQRSTIDDAVLDVYSVDVPRWWQIVPVLWHLRTGQTARSPYLTTLRGTAIRIQTRRPRPVTADGEIVTTTPAEFRVAPRALEVYCPHPAHSASSGVAGVGLQGSSNR